jgi:hypothetical protein
MRRVARDNSNVVQQEICRSELVNFPRGHSTHEVCPGAGCAKPAVQDGHSVVADTFEAVPVGQSAAQ